MDDPEEQERLRQLNALLRSLGITIAPLTSTLELTPTLLVAIMESILRERLPLNRAQRECKTREGKNAAMKIFLGVFGDLLAYDDLLHLELSSIDLRRLADGSREETTLIARLLCALVTQTNLPVDFESPSISTTSSVAGGSTTTFSKETETWTAPTTVPSRSSDLSFLSTQSQADYDSILMREDAIPQSPPRLHSQTHRTTHLRISSEDIGGPLPIRYQGWISPVKGDLEIFETSRTMLEGTSPIDATATVSSVSRLTIDLLNEKAGLLEKLARAAERSFSVP